MKHPMRSMSTFRLHLMLTAAIVTVGFAIVIAAAMFAPLFAILDRGDVDRAVIGGIADYVIHLHSSYWPVVVVMITASVVSGMLLFRRMSDPLVRFVEGFEGVRRGEIREIRSLRRSDYLQNEAAALSAMLQALRDRAEADEHDLVRLEKGLHDLAEQVRDPDAAAAIADLREAAEALRSRLPRCV